MLRALTSGRTVPVPGALLANRLVLRCRDVVLEEGHDYLIDPRWGALGVGPSGRVTPEDDIEASYSYTLLRLDSIVLAEGAVQYLLGEPHLSTPLPAAMAGYGSLLANVLVRQGPDGPEVDVFPIAAACDAPTRTTFGALPRTTAKLRRGERTRVLCWGDSITVGGEAAPGNRYVDVLTRGLEKTYPAAPVVVDTVAVGASSSVHWIFPDEYRHPVPEWQPRCDWRLVEESEPDLVVIEFLNDCGRTRDELVRTYAEILRRLDRWGPEVVLLTPPFTEMDMMGMRSLRDEDRRPYVAFLHELAAGHGLAVADGSGRWAHLWREGIPYITLLRNGINHPDDRGHGLLAEELLRCLDADLAAEDRHRLYPA